MTDSQQITFDFERSKHRFALHMHEDQAPKFGKSGALCIALMEVIHRSNKHENEVNRTLTTSLLLSF